MDDLNRVCSQALRERRATYHTWRCDPSPQTYAAYAAAFDFWRTAAGAQSARQLVWQARRRGMFLAALRHTLRPAIRKALASR